MKKKLIGNAVVGQSGGPTAAINATLAGVIRGVLDGNNKYIGTLYGMKNGIEGLLDEKLIDLNDFFSDRNKINILETTPAAALGSCRKKLPDPDENDEIYKKIIRIFEKYGIRYFFYIGGNDSMDTVAKLTVYTEKCGYEMRIIGIPKTIDNDLTMTDHTPGFGSAAKYVAVSIQEMIRDCSVYTVKAVTIVEIMGRDAGWLTAASAVGMLSGSPVPDGVYLPEYSFDMNRFFDDIARGFEKKPNLLIAVSEGLRFADGKYVGEGTQSGAQDIFGHRYLAGTAKALEHAVKEKFGCKVRSVELNIPQRCASHIASATDINESVSIGRAAVNAATEGCSGQMMCFERVSDLPYECTITYKDVLKIANKVKTVPREYINKDCNGITEECCRYIVPLIYGEKYPEYENGLPKHIII